MVNAMRIVFKRNGRYFTQMAKRSNHSFNRRPRPAVASCTATQRIFEFAGGIRHSVAPGAISKFPLAGKDTQDRRPACSVRVSADYKTYEIRCENWGKFRPNRPCH